MIRRLSHIALSPIVLFFLLLSSCYYEEEITPGGEDVEKVQVTLFTRMSNYATPVSRATEEIDKTDHLPMVLVYAESGSEMIFVEAAQAQLLANGRIIVSLEKRSDPCQFLILANPDGDVFYRDVDTKGTYAFAAENFNTWLGGGTPKTLDYTCEHLFSVPLDPSTSSPFSGYLPMSEVFESSGGIYKGLQIADADNPLRLKRNVAKVTLNSSVANFTLKRIVNVANTPKQGQWYRPAGEQIMNYAVSDRVGYDVDDTVFYLYESAMENDTYMIIEGTYEDEDYFYKMAFVDNNHLDIDLVRNYAYTFTITHVEGRGHDTVEEAVIASPYNNSIITNFVMTDLSDYETLAADDYYLSVSNSAFIAFYGGGNTTFTVLTLAAQGRATETVNGTIKVPGGVTLLNPAGGTFSTSDATLLSGLDIQIQLASTFSSGEIKIAYGNLEKIIRIERKAAISTTGSMFSFYDASGFTYYCLTGEVESATGRITLLSSAGRTETELIAVDDGEIRINVAAGSGNAGTVWLTTTANPEEPEARYPKRVKIDIYQ